MAAILGKLSLTYAPTASSLCRRAGSQTTRSFSARQVTCYTNVCQQRVCPCLNTINAAVLVIKLLIHLFQCRSIMAGALKLLANAQPFHRVAIATILEHALLCINVQSSKVSFPFSAVGCQFSLSCLQKHSVLVPIKVMTMYCICSSSFLMKE